MEGWEPTPSPCAPTEPKLIPIVTTAPDADPVALARLYRQRWPVQENILKYWLLPLGLDTNHGFAKTPVENSEVAKRREAIERRLANIQRWAPKAHERAQRAARLSERLRQETKAHGDALYRRINGYTCEHDRGDEQTVPATGQNFLPATYASGIINIWSGYSAKTWNLGTIFYGQLTSGAAYNIILTTDVGTTSVVVNVAAQAAQAGASGNFASTAPAWAWKSTSCSGSPPCTDGSTWSVQSAGPFTGGGDAQTVSVVQQNDIDGAANSLISANQPNPQQVLQSQMQSNERLIGTPQCTPSVSSDHEAGDQATQVTVTVIFTCTEEVYDHNGALALVANLLKSQAANNPGAGYVLVGQIQTNLTNATLGGGGTMTLTVSADGVWAYQFSNTLLQGFAQLIAGTTTQQAQQILSSQTGVAQATVQVGGNGQILPLDPSKITIVVQSVPGA